MSQLLRTKSIDALIASSEEPEHRLHKSLGVGSLIALGIGAVIGSGIFTVTGTAAAGEHFMAKSILKAPVLDLLLNGGNAATLSGRAGAGPAISISFVLVAIACGFAAICYAELASMIPIAGSAYTYSYATLGEIFAWIIGWDLILEYAFSNMSVAVGFSAYFNDILDNLFGFHLPQQLSQPIFVEGQRTGAWFNLPALLVMLALSYILVRGVRESARTNNAMVIIKVAAILLFVFGAARAINTANWHPFMPNGYLGRADRRRHRVLHLHRFRFGFHRRGRMRAAAARHADRHLSRRWPSARYYTVGVSLVLTGIANWTTLDNAAPVANALKAIGMNRLRLIVTAGALLGMVSSLLVFQYGQARIWFAMSRDRLLPSVFSRVHPKFKTPHVSTWVAGFVVGIPAGVFDIAWFADLSNIGTLFAFILVSAGVIVLRKKQPERKRGFRVPLVPLLPGISIVLLPGSDAEPSARNLDPLLRVAGHRLVRLLQLWPEAYG